MNRIGARNLSSCQYLARTVERRVLAGVREFRPNGAGHAWCPHRATHSIGVVSVVRLENITVFKVFRYRTSLANLYASAEIYQSRRIVARFAKALADDEIIRYTCTSLQLTSASSPVRVTSARDV